MSRILGIKKGKNKEGNPSYVYYFSDDYSDYERNNAECLGSPVSSIYSSKDFKVNVGDELELIYGRGFQDKAVLKEIRIISERTLKINK